ncbi:MAG TPA: EAL domain-containing protein [Steroidobacteraceae bacterium]|jgi:diguanylate cyclase (GGDEF)-like protein|nr:EAL domain-containing protein [Steroidobacteraceae bacterium]
MTESALKSRMGRRIALTLAVAAILPIMVLAVMAAWVVGDVNATRVERRLQGASQAFARSLRSRFGAAETLVQTLTSRDVGYDGSALKQQIVNSRAFKSAVIVDRDGLLAGGEATLRPTPSQLLSLEAGRTVVLHASLSGQQPAIFLAHSVIAGGVDRLAYFEIAPDWLWKDLSGDMLITPLAVVDADGTVLQSTVPLMSETGRMFGERIKQTSTSNVASHALAWQGAGEEWHGVLTHLPLIDERITTVPWAVVAMGRGVPFFARTRDVWNLLPYAIGLALLSAWLGAEYLARRHVPALRSVEGGLRALATRRFDRVSVAAVDEPRALVRAFNAAAGSLEEQFRALETLAEIDQLLLGSAELEQMLESILERVQTVTRCHGVGITLIDGDAPGRGRIYLAANGLTGLPVSRVSLDDDMVATLASETQGLTITRCEERRHSFLQPLSEIGSEFFWVWPVAPGERVEAILAVGYREAPTLDPQVANCGSEFAQRLAIALSKTARDERLHRQAHYDPLTSLPNRLLFLDRLNQELSSATAGLSRGALLYIDLDHFKRVNDTVGHAAGDQLLTIVAQRLRSCVKEGDTVARLGGDEFTVILRNVADPDAARAVAERIIESVQLPVNIGGRDQFVAASIGITLFPDDGMSIEELMRNADTAMYRAKDLGRGRAMFFDLHMTAKPSAPTETGLHRALRRREFSLFYQPQFSVADGSLMGLEALLRWQTPRDGLRFPGEFVPAAEESGLIVDIGGWVLETACAQLAEWRDQKIAPPRLALNVSAQQLKHAEFPKAVRRALDKYNIPPDLLELELTESVFADEAAGAALVRLSQIGVHLALDDFGTGYSSLNYLRQYPIGTVKIDRTFLEEVPQNPASATLVETIVVMAHALGKRVVAEGIEAVEQLEFLRERHCDIAQGFYLARPLATTAVTELLQARTIAARAPEGDIREVG